MKSPIAALSGVLATSLMFASACAGDLKNPERFSKLLSVHDSGVRSAHDAAMDTTHDSGLKPPPACVVQISTARVGYPAVTPRAQLKSIWLRTAWLTGCSTSLRRTPRARAAHWSPPTALRACSWRS